MRGDGEETFGVDETDFCAATFYSGFVRENLKPAVDSRSK